MAERREREVRLMTTEAVELAHEINQPLVAITNYALAARRRLASGTGDAAKVEELIDKIGTQASRARRCPSVPAGHGEKAPFRDDQGGRRPAGD